MNKRDILLLALGRLPVQLRQWGEVVLIGHARLAREDVAEIGEWVFAVPLARYDNRLDDSGALTGVGVADEKPVFLADARRTNRILYFDMVITPSRARDGSMLSTYRAVSTRLQLGVIPRRTRFRSALAMFHRHWRTGIQEACQHALRRDSWARSSRPCDH